MSYAGSVPGGFGLSSRGKGKCSNGKRKGLNSGDRVEGASEIAYHYRGFFWPRHGKRRRCIKKKGSENGKRHRLGGEMPCLQREESTVSPR